MTRVFIISDFADPTPTGRSEKVNTRVRVFRECGLDPVVVVPFHLEAPGDRPDGIETVKYPGWKYFSIFSKKILSRALAKFGFPDAYFRWIFPAVRAIARHSPNCNDVIITMANPVSNHLVGLLCKGRFGMKWIADFRDPWVLNKLVYYRWRFLQRKLEEITAYKADRLIVLSGYEMPEDYFGKTYHVDSTKIIKFGYVGYDRVKVQRSWSKDSNTLVFAGAFYAPDVTPVPLLKGLRNYLDNKSESNDIHLEFYGTWDPEWQVLTENLNLQGHVKAYGFRPHQEVIQALARSSGALVVVPDLQHELGWVPSKVSEYIGLRVPILAICPISSVLNRLVKTYDLGVSVPAEEIASGIDTLVRRVDEGNFQKPRPDPKGFDRVYNERALADEVAKLSVE